MRPTLALPLTLAATLVLAAPAVAAPVGLTGGATTLKLDSATAKALTGAGFSLGPVSPARATSAGLRFAITGGHLDAGNAAGVVPHSGGLRLRRAGAAVSLTKFKINTTGSVASLSAVVNGGARANVIRLRTGAAKVGRDGLAIIVSGVRAELTSIAAKALNRAFDVTLFKPGLRLGTASIDAAPKSIRFTGGTTSLAVSPGAGGALQQLGITPGPIAPAAANADGSLAFPIVPDTSKVDAKSLAGTIRHRGGIALTRGDTVVRLSDFDIVIDATPSLAAALNGGSPKAEILSLDVSGLTGPTIAARTVTVGGVVAKLTAAAAAALNQAFSTSAFSEGLVLGTATVRGAI